jgi:hypothetical protein
MPLLVCTEPPAGRGRWYLRNLSRRLIRQAQVYLPMPISLIACTLNLDVLSCGRIVVLAVDSTMRLSTL